MRIGDIVENIHSDHKWVLGMIFPGVHFPHLADGTHAWLVRATNVPRADKHEEHEMVCTTVPIELVQPVADSGAFLQRERQFTYGDAPATIVACTHPFFCTVKFQNMDRALDMPRWQVALCLWHEFLSDDYFEESATPFRPALPEEL